MNRGCIGISNEDVDHAAGVAAGFMGGLPGVQSGNCLIGWEAGHSLQMTNTLVSGNGAGAYNTFIGYQSGTSNTTGDSNTSVGYQSGPATASSDVCIGYQAGQLDTGGTGTFIGYQAGASNVSGASGTYVGYQAGKGATGGSDVMIGYQAGIVSTAGNNVMIGYQAGLVATSATQNVLIGYQAGKATVGNGLNVCIGYQAGLAMTGGSSVMIGNLAGSAVTTGSQNTYVGYEAGRTTTFGNANVSGANQTFIGYNAGPPSGTQASQVTAVGAAAAAGNGTGATALGAGASAGAAGAVAIGCDHTGTGASSNTQDLITLGTTNHTTLLPGNIAYTVNTPTVSAGATTVIANARVSNVVVSATTAITVSTSGALDGMEVYVRITDGGSTQTLSWVNTENSTVSAPLASPGSSTLPRTAGFMFNGRTSLWRCILNV